MEHRKSKQTMISDEDINYGTSPCLNYMPMNARGGLNGLILNTEFDKCMMT